MAVGAHAADFVWRAGGALALAGESGGTARVIALSYGEKGESGELWKEEGQTIENVKKVRAGRGRSQGIGADSLLRPR
jgi:4-oxalomesaconate hydratase